MNERREKATTRKEESKDVPSVSSVRRPNGFFRGSPVFENGAENGASLKKLIYVSVYVSFTYFAYLYIFVCCMLQPIELFGVSTI